MSTIFHADDFGINPSQSARILECKKTGKLNSLSIMANSPRGQECAALLSSKLPRVSVHLNLTEGRPCLPAAEVPLLVNDRGCFCLGFVGLLKKSLAGKNSEFCAQVKRELICQCDMAKALLPEGTPLFADSHQHVHMIPAIFDIVLSLGCEGVRLTNEPVSPFFRKPGVLFSIRPVNWIKTFVLKTCSIFDTAMLRKKGIGSPVFFGLLMTGQMDMERVSAVLPYFERIAEKKGRDLEILFHPGRSASNADCLDPENPELCAAQLSPNRDIEYCALMGIGSENIASAMEIAQ